MEAMICGMTTQERRSPANPQRQAPHPHCQGQRRERDGTEHDAEQIRRDAADDEEDGQVLENDGQNGRRFAGNVAKVMCQIKILFQLARNRRIQQCFSVSEIIFEVQEDEADGGYVATALGHAIATQGETIEELREMVRDAVRCHFGDGVPGKMPSVIRLHFVRDEVLAT